MGPMPSDLEKSRGPVTFADLRAHVARGAVIVVAQSLDLLVVGEAVAKDDKAQVAAWIEAGLLGKPTLETLARWEKKRGDVGESLVVQPFVLLKELLD